MAQPQRADQAPMPGDARARPSPAPAPLERPAAAASSGPGKKQKALKSGTAWQRFRTTREGKAFIFVTLGVGLAAINTGNNLLFLIFGFMLSLVVMSGILSEIALRGVRVRRRLPDRAFAASTALVEISLRNQKRWTPSYSLEVEDLADGMPTERRCYFLKVAASAEQVASYRRTFRRRGRVKLNGFRIATRYPFGIIEKWRVVHDEAELLVYPALLRDRTLDDALRSIGADAESARTGAGSEIAGLRHYQPGDAAREIHWRRTAALSRVVVLERHSDASARVTLVLDNARPAGADERWTLAFEQAVSRAAALCVDCGGRELAVEVLCRGQRSPLVLAGSPVDPVLRFLALIEPIPEQDAPPFDRMHAASVVRIPITPAS